MLQAPRIPVFQSWTDYLMDWIDCRPADMLARHLRAERAQDPGRPRGHLPARDGCSATWASTNGDSADLQRAVAKGYFVVPDALGAPAVRRAARAIPRSRRSWQKRKQAVSTRWPPSARPAASGCSARDRAARDEEPARDSATGTRSRRRLREVRPHSVRRWGRMSAHQMVCHLSDSFLMVTGQKPVSHATSLLHRTVVKWIALYLPLRVAGRNSDAAGNRSGGGWHEAGRLRGRCCAARGAAGADHHAGTAPDWQLHPIFGRMSEAAWLRWAYLHMDHHLRQFGA